MFSIFSKHMILSGIIVTLCAISILIQLAIGRYLMKLIQETENMSVTDIPLLKQCKRKFTNCYKLNGGILNVPVFVDKFINKITILRIPLPKFKHLSGQAMLLSVFTAGVGACRGILNSEPVLDILPYYIISLFGLYVYFSVSAAVDISGKRSVLKTNMVDYLENNLMNRLETLEEDLKIIEPEKPTAREERRFFQKSRERELEELLQEFLA